MMNKGCQQENERGRKIRIPLPEEETLDLLLKVKPTDEMPSRKKKEKNPNKGPKRRRPTKGSYERQT